MRRRIFQPRLAVPFSTAIFLAAPVLAAFLLASLAPAEARAECSSAEVVATVLFQGDLALGVLEPYRVSVIPMGAGPPPTDAEIRTELGALFPPAGGWATGGAAPPFRLWEFPPADFGAAAIVDDRDGHIPFFGTVTWAGHGHVVLPAASTHGIAELGGPPAAAPVVTSLPNLAWDSDLPSLPSTAELTALAAEWLRSTDLGHAFAACAPPWEVVGHVYTPAIAFLDVNAAELVLVVRGRPGPPWGPVSVDAESWGRTKARWR